MTLEPIAVVSKIRLGVENRDGETYVVKAHDGRHFLVLTADTFHNAEEFRGMGSTQHVEISEKAFLALTDSKPASRTEKETGGST